MVNLLVVAENRDRHFRNVISNDIFIVDIKSTLSKKLICCVPCEPNDGKSHWQRVNLASNLYMVLWNLFVTTASIIKFITCDLFRNVF